SPSPPVVGTADPLYSRTFVGREHELRQLQSAYDAALSGQGSLAMVVGEPGIGKTSLCEQLATYVALRGGRALVGHCYEEGSLSLPYLPFVEVMRSYVLARDPEGLKTDLGSGAAEVARIVSAGTYRDVEVDRSHPLSGALADLRRGSNFLRVPLRGLTAEEVQRMMVSVAQREIPWAFAELLHRQTEGNPLFVQEMLRYLVEEGLVTEQEGALRRVGDESLAGRIPEGLRDVIGKRLSRLSDKT